MEAQMSEMSSTIIDITQLHTNLQDVITQVTELVTEQHAANIMAMWRVGELLAEIDNNPDAYLTDTQKTQHVNPSALLFQAFHKVYTPDSFNTSRQLYENYPSKEAIQGLINLRCPARPNWRVTASHVQLLLTVSDPDKRKVLEDRCAKQAYTTKALAVELSELKGEPKKAERAPTAPKGLKQRLYDLLEHQRKFISRSEKLWVEDNGLYDALMNSAPDDITETMRGYMAEIVENFYKMQELIDTHQALCKKFDEQFNSEEEDADISNDVESFESRHKQKGITR
jgi:hypothetical protein